MKKSSNIFLFISLMLIITDCREPFSPDFKTGENDYLVVEGFINIGQKAVTTIALSRVVPLLKTQQTFEMNAIVNIENKDGTRYSLQEKGNGVYLSDSIDLNLTSEYRLLITTQNGKISASDFVKPKITPPIDSLHWQWEDSGINVYVNTHDNTNNTRYYNWDYTETWEINSDHLSRYSYTEGKLKKRSDAEMYNLYLCWQSASAETLHFASTVQFDEDKIRYPIVHLAHYSDRTSVKYSILVKQRSMTKEEFDYLQLIQKNSNITGSLFDAMPSEITGNIKSLNNPDETIIGYVGAYTTQIKRYFIDASELSSNPRTKCEVIEISAERYGSTYSAGGYFIPVDSVDDKKSKGASSYCMDCKIRGGTHLRPDFWP